MYRKIRKSEYLAKTSEKNEIRKEEMKKADTARLLSVFSGLNKRARRTSERIKIVNKSGNDQIAVMISK